jgi:hypothetical protein
VSGGVILTDEQARDCAVAIRSYLPDEEYAFKDGYRLICALLASHEEQARQLDAAQFLKNCVEAALLKRENELAEQARRLKPFRTIVETFETTENGGMHFGAGLHKLGEREWLNLREPIMAAILAAGGSGEDTPC